MVAIDTVLEIGENFVLAGGDVVLGDRYPALARAGITWFIGTTHPKNVCTTEAKITLAIRLGMAQYVARPKREGKRIGNH